MPRQPFKPYFIGGLSINGFVWEYTSGMKAVLGEDGDGIVAALNMCGRFFLNMWGDETAKEHEAAYDSGNAFMLNLGPILHL